MAVITSRSSVFDFIKRSHSFLTLSPIIMNKRVNDNEKRKRKNLE
jgi:CRISPR/Cas system endoribonuclease Cas6 (RAMP superfamily)